MFLGGGLTCNLSSDMSSDLSSIAFRRAAPIFARDVVSSPSIAVKTTNIVVSASTGSPKKTAYERLNEIRANVGPVPQCQYLS